MSSEPANSGLERKSKTELTGEVGGDGLVAVQQGTEAPSASWSWADQPISWNSWNAAAFEQARQLDLPILLYLAAPGGEEVFSRSGPAVRSLLEESFVPIRVDPFKRPDLARQYGAGGWPTVAALLPDRRAFSLALDLPAEHAELYLWRLRSSFDSRREIIESKVNSAERAAARAAPGALDPGRVYDAIVGSFDPIHGGFGGPAKYPEFTVLEFLLEYHLATGELRALDMVSRTLQPLLDRPMRDQLGGLLAYSHTPDWETPVAEMDALDQAGLLAILSKVDRAGKGPAHAAQANSLVRFVHSRMFDADRGLFYGRMVRAESGWWTDPTVYADRNARLISACLLIWDQYGQTTAAEMAKSAGRYLVDHCLGIDGDVYHTCDEETAGLAGLLHDQILVATALVGLWQATGDTTYQVAAERLRHYAEQQHFDAARQAFRDLPVSDELSNPPEPEAFSYRDDWLPAGNVLAAELYLGIGRPEQARNLLAGNRLTQPPDRAYSSYARLRLKISSAGDRIDTGSRQGR